MSKITITDSHQIAVTGVPVNLVPLSAIVKYAQSPDLSLILPPEITSALDVPLKSFAAAPASLGIQIGKAFDFGAGRPQFSIGAGPSAAVRVNVQDGEGYLSFALTGTVTGKGSQSEGDVTLGFQAGASATFEFFRKFKVDDATPTLRQALGAAISHFALPTDVADLRAIDVGDIATCSGNRHLKVSGDFSASVSAVPLATPKLPLAGKAIQLNAGAKIDVSTSFEIASSWQIRTQAVSDGVVELGFYKQHGGDWDVTSTPSTGIDVGLGSKDLLTALIDKLSKVPEADKKQLEAAGLEPDEIKAINAAISSSIDRSIHASLSLDLSGLDSAEAAFLYRIELDKLNADTAAAVTSALGGDLTAIDRLNPLAEENGAAGPGITLLRSILTRTKKTGARFKINFIGLFNFLSLCDFISQSQVVHEPVSGDVVFKETASGERIGAVTLPQAQTKLRKTIFDSIVMTTAYRSGGALETTQMDCSNVHFALHTTTNEHTMSDYLDWFLALGLLNAQGKAELMTGFHGTGSSTCTVRVAFNDVASKAMFLDASDGARDARDFVSIGRNALKALLMPGDENDSDRYRRDVLGSDTIWGQFEGQTAIGPVLREERGWRLDDPRIAVLATDYSVIVWWADAMSSTAVKIVEMRDFLKNADPAALDGNQAFIGKKADLQKHVMGVVANSPMNFDQPFGLVALAWAAGPAAIATGILQSPAINREFGAVAQRPALKPPTGPK
ncbi:MAG: hypothetical protein M3Y07_09485 [Acidobacteriota bacterium]|nr:hypothetical protein [Acidobacteriota bacterium]